jgi:MFS family permease
VAVAGVPLLRTTEQASVKDFSYDSAWRIIFAKRHRRMVLAMIGWGENLVHLVFWPIFIFLIVESDLALGLIASLSMLGTSIWGFVIGELTDRWSPRRVLRLFVPLTAVSYIFRAISGAPLAIAGADAYARVTQTSVSIPFVAKLYRAGRGAGALQYAVAFEIVLAITKALVAWGLAFLFLYVAAPLGFMIMFAVAGALAFFYLFL